MDRVKDKVAVITGAAGGLGKAQALLLAQEGARVIVTDIHETDRLGIAEEIGRKGGESLYAKLDVTREAEWEAVIERTLSEHGRLDILVNNAGVILTKPIEETTLEEWRWVTSVNLDGVFLGTKHAIGAMKKSRGGSIVNVSSVAGIVGMPNSSSYVASKGGVRLFSKAAAVECSKAGRDYHIRVNSIHPGFIMTPMIEDIIQAGVKKTGKKYEEARKLREDWTLVGRLGEAEEVAYAVLYLASDESAFITGTEIVIDGGFTAR